MAVDTIEGVLQDVLHYHYDVEADVLYLRLCAAVGQEVYGEEDEHGFHVMRLLTDDRAVGMTVVGFWRQFGDQTQPLTQVPDWERRLERTVDTVGRGLLAA